MPRCDSENPTGIGEVFNISCTRSIVVAVVLIRLLLQHNFENGVRSVDLFVGFSIVQRRYNSIMLGTIPVYCVRTCDRW